MSAQDAAAPTDIPADAEVSAEEEDAIPSSPQPVKKEPAKKKSAEKKPAEKKKGVDKKKGKTGLRRHTTKESGEPTMAFVNRSSTHKLARRAKVKRVSHGVADSSQHVVKEVMREILRQAMVHMENGRRKTLHEVDVFRAGSRLGYVVYSQKMFPMNAK